MEVLRSQSYDHCVGVLSGYPWKIKMWYQWLFWVNQILFILSNIQLASTASAINHFTAKTGIFSHRHMLLKSFIYFRNEESLCGKGADVHRLCHPSQSTHLCVWAVSACPAMILPLPPPKCCRLQITFFTEQLFVSISLSLHIHLWALQDSKAGTLVSSPSSLTSLWSLRIQSLTVPLCVVMVAKMVLQHGLEVVSPN